MFFRLKRISFLLPLLLMASVHPGVAGSPLRFGVITLNHPLTMYRQYLPFTDYVSRESGIGLELVLAKDYRSIIDDLLAGELDVALLGGLSYVVARDASAEVVPLCAVLSPEGTPTDRTVIFCRKDSDMQTLRDLAGKRFAFASTLSTAGYLRPLCFLGEHGIPAASFGATDNLRTHEAVVQSVLRGRHDTGAVSEATFRRFADKGELKVLAETPPHPGFVIVARRADVPGVQILKEFLLGLDVSVPRLAPAVSKWSPRLRNGFTQVTDQDYAPIRKLRDCARRYGYGSHADAFSSGAAVQGH